MTTCPLCQRPLSDRWLWMCAAESPCPPPDGAPSRVSGALVTAPADPTPGPPAPPPACPTCGGPVVEVCPHPGCHLELPARWRTTTATHIVMAGARATGKSIYIAVLVKQMELLGDLTGMRFTVATRASHTTYRATYEVPLFAQRGMLQATRSAQGDDHPDPMIFEIATAAGSRHHLVVTDYAGEDLDQGVAGRATLRAFGVADAVVLLFDPLSIPDVMNVVRGLIPPQRPSGDGRATLSNVINLIGPRRPRLAVAMAKFDVLHAARAVPGVELGRIMQNTGAAFSREPERRAGYDERDGQLLHEELRSLLLKLGAGALVNAMGVLTTEQAIDYRFFAVSALGDSPDGSYLHDRGIAPFRCLDPLRWILQPQGV